MKLTLTKKQLSFIRSDAFEVLYGGAAGGGKSYAQMSDALIYALKYPASRQILFRRTLPELEKSLVRIARELYPGEIFTYSKTAHSGTFSNGSVIDFAYCDNEDDVYRYQSAEYDVIRFDELTHFTENMYIYLLSRCRGVSGYPKQVKSTTNPGGVGHSWVKSRFIDIGAPAAVHTVKDSTRVFIPAKLTDNPFLMQNDPDYIKRLALLDERDRRALLLGEWDIEEGRFFESFDRSVHVIKPFIVPSDWRRYIAIDYGLDMLAAYKIAVDFEGRGYVVGEVYGGKDNGGDGLIVSKAAREILALCGTDNIRSVYAPPDLWNRQKDSGKSIARLFFENGVSLTRVTGSRVSGWMALKEWFAVYEGKSRLVICDNCTNLIRSLTSLKCDARNPSDCALHPHEVTHAPDALRYFAQGSPAAPSVPTTGTPAVFGCEKPKRSPLGYGDKINVI